MYTNSPTRNAFPLLVLLAFLAPLASAADAGSVKGVIKFEGEAKRLTLNRQMEGTPECIKANTKPDGSVKKVGTENILAKDGLLQNVIIYVMSGLPEGKHDAPGGKIVINQIGCMYTPHVITMRTGQELVFKSSDATLHNVHGRAPKNGDFNDGQPVPGETKPRVFQQPEFITVKCDVHPWMSAFVGVFEHPFHVVTGKDGAFELKGLPAGELTIAAWHEEFDELEQKVTVAAGETKVIEFTFKQAKPADE